MSYLTGLKNLALGLAGALAIAACTLPVDENEPQVAMGDFSLGLNVVVAKEPEIGPYSRTATNEEWIDMLTPAIEKRLGGYEGEKLYNLGVSIEGYTLAKAGIPVVLAPKSVLIVNVLVWDDETQTRLNPEGPKQLIVFESISGDVVVSSGLMQSRDEQMENLTRNAAKAIQDYLLENPEWFGLPPRQDEPQVAEAEVGAPLDAIEAPADTVQVLPLDAPELEAEATAN